jgi:hypothetical protein
MKQGNTLSVMSGLKYSTSLGGSSAVTGRDGCDNGDADGQWTMKRSESAGHCAELGNPPCVCSPATEQAKILIPSLKNRRLKISGKMPRLVPVRLSAETRSVEPDAATAQTVEPIPEPLAAPVECVPQRVEVKVIPTPRKREPRSVTPVVEASEIPKPLKVIRKRKEEAPKVIETVPRPMPQSMLAGIEAACPDSQGGSR